MAKTIPEQLAAASVTDTLKHAVIPGEGEWLKMPWATGRGSDSESGWKPEGYAAHEPDGSRSGWLWLPGAQPVNRAYTILKRSGAFGHIGGVEFRQFSVWVFAQNTAKANGYQVCMKQTSTEDKYIIRLGRLFEGALTTLFESGEVVMKGTGEFAITHTNGKVAAWLREEEGKEFVIQGTEVADVTFLQGLSGVDGDGSNPTLINFRTGLLEAPELVVPKNPARGLTLMRGR